MPTSPLPSSSLPLFPLQVARYIPSPWKTADLRQVARTADGHDFAAKWEHEGVGLPASEWLGERLARACQIATPFTAILTDASDRLGFGSRIEGSVTSFDQMTVPEKLEVLAACGRAMSGLLALDLFVGNEDRHMGNWLFRRNLAGEWAPLCIDFSRALFCRGFPHDTWPPTNCNTTSTMALLKIHGGWDSSHAVISAERLQHITPQVLRHWLQECPKAWLPEATQVALLAWWSSPAYHARLQRTYALL